MDGLTRCWAIPRYRSIAAAGTLSTPVRTTQQRIQSAHIIGGIKAAFVKHAIEDLGLGAQEEPEE